MNTIRGYPKNWLTKLAARYSQTSEFFPNTVVLMTSQPENLTPQRPMIPGLGGAAVVGLTFRKFDNSADHPVLPPSAAFPVT